VYVTNSQLKIKKHPTWWHNLKKTPPYWCTLFLSNLLMIHFTVFQKQNLNVLKTNKVKGVRMDKTQNKMYSKPTVSHINIAGLVRF
jgi:hypothetical protein